MSNFSERLKSLRLESGLQQKDIVDILHLSGQQVVSKWENGSRPSVDKIAALAENFGVSFEYMIGESDFRNAEEERRHKLDVLRERAISYDIHRRINDFISEIQNQYVKILGSQRELLSDRELQERRKLSLQIYLIGQITDMLERAAIVTEPSFLSERYPNRNNVELATLLIDIPNYITEDLHMTILKWLIKNHRMWDSENAADGNQLGEEDNDGV